MSKQIDFSVGEYAEMVLENYPSYRLREKPNNVFHATDAGKCTRLTSYKKLGYKESNPTDLYGKMRMGFGNYTEAGLKYELFTKTHVFGFPLMSAQGDCGEQNFYDVQWTGYRDFDFAVWNEDKTQLVPVIVELKVKVGFGAKMMIHETAYGSKKIVPPLDFDWGYPQQLSLYLHDFYKHKKEQVSWLRNGGTLQGALVFYLYFDGGCGFVEYHCKYNPETDTVTFFEVKSKQFPECNGKINETVSLQKIGETWKMVDGYLQKNELAPPSFERRYALNDPRIKEFPKTKLEQAARNNLLLGDKQCQYCSFKDKCAKDLGVTLSYTKEEIGVIKGLISDRDAAQGARKKKVK